MRSRAASELGAVRKSGAAQFTTAGRDPEGLRGARRQVAVAATSSNAKLSGNPRAQQRHEGDSLRDLVAERDGAIIAKYNYRFGS